MNIVKRQRIHDKSDKQRPESRPTQKRRHTPVNCRVDADGNILEVVTGRNVVLPTKVNSAKANWREVGHDPLAALVQSNEVKHLKVRKPESKRDKATIMINPTHELDKKGRLVRKPSKDTPKEKRNG